MHAPAFPPAHLFGGVEASQLPVEALRLAQARFSAGPGPGLSPSGGGGGGGGGSELDLRQLSAPVPGMNPSISPNLAPLHFRRARAPAPLLSMGSAPLGGGGGGGGGGAARTPGPEGAAPAGLLHTSASAGALSGGGSPSAAQQPGALLHAQVVDTLFCMADAIQGCRLVARAYYAIRAI